MCSGLIRLHIRLGKSEQNVMAKLGKQSKLVILGTFFTSVLVENFSGVSGTPLEYDASGKILFPIWPQNGKKSLAFASFFQHFLPTFAQSDMEPYQL